MYISQLNQLLDLGVIEEADSKKLKNNIDSVSTQMRRDAYFVKTSKNLSVVLSVNMATSRPEYDINSKKSQK